MKGNRYKMIVKLRAITVLDKGARVVSDLTQGIIGCGLIDEPECVKCKGQIMG